MATELAKAYVQIIPSAEGITGKLGEVMNGEASSAGASSGESLAKSLGATFKKAFVALGLGKVISDVIGNTSEFETGMAKVKTLFSGTAEEFNQLQEDILGLSSSYGISVQELTEAAYSAESAGVAQEDLLYMLEHSAELAKAGFTDLDTALSATAKTMNAYGEAAGTAEDVQKVLIQTQNLGITTVGELGASLANVTPTAAAMGVSFDQVGAALALMTAKGTPTAQATTQLRSAMVELGKEGTKGAKALEAAAKGTEFAGMSFKEMMANGADLGDVMGMLQAYADKTGVSMVDLFSSVEAGNAAMSIASDVETFTKDLAAMGTEADVVGEGYTTMASTFGESMNKMKNSFSNLGIALSTGVDIGPALDTLIASLTEVLSSAGTMIFNMVKGIFDNLPLIFDSLLDLGSDLLTKLTEIDWASLGTTIITAIGNFLPDFITKGGEIVSNLIGGITENAPTILSTIAGAMGDVIAKIGEALPDLLTKGSEITKNLLSGLNENAPGISEAIGTILTSISTAITEAFPSISEGISNIVSAFEPLVSDITTSFENVVSTITTAITDITTALAPYIPAITEMVTNTTAQLPSIIESFNSIVSTITTAITDIVAAIAPYIPDITQMVTETTKQLPNIISAFNDIVSTISGAITSIVEAIAPYIPDITNMVETTVSKLPEIITAFQGVVDSIGPIIDSIGEVIGKIGTAVTEIVNSLGTNIASIVDSFSGLLTSLEGPINSVASLIESIGTAIGTVIDAVGNCVSSINESFSKVLDSLKGVIDSIGEGAVKAGEGFSTLADAIIKLVNQTGFFDLAATLTKVAGAVGDIAKTGKDAGDAYTNLEKLVGTLSSLAESDFGTMNTMLDELCDNLYVITLYTPTLKDTKKFMEDLGKVKLSDLNKELETANTKVDTLKSTVETGFEKIKTTISEKMKSATESIKTMMTDSKNEFDKFDWKGIGTSLTNKIRDGINEAKSNVLAAFTQIRTDVKSDFDKFDFKSLGTKAVNSIRDGISGAASNVTSAMSTIVTDTAKKITDHAWKTDGENMATAIKDGINGKAGEVTSAMSDAASDAKNQFSDVNWEEIGENSCKGIAQGIKDNAYRINDEMKAAAKAAVQSAKDELKIESPSKVMRDQIGRWIPEGIAAGIAKYSGSIDRAMEDIAVNLSGTNLESSLMAQNRGLSFGMRGGTSAAVGGFNQNITINSPEALTPSEVARQTRIQTQNLVLAMRGA